MRNKVMGWYDAAANASTRTLPISDSIVRTGPYFPVKIQRTVPVAKSLNQRNQHRGVQFPGRPGLDFYLADE